MRLLLSSQIGRSPVITADHVTIAGASFTYSGRQVGLNHEMPTATDIGIALGRICRFAGNGLRFYTVLQHSMAAADMLGGAGAPAELYALLHDATESIIGDIPRGFKTDELKQIEGELSDKLLESFSLAPMNLDKARLVKWADDRALLAEVWTVGPECLRRLPRFAERDVEAEKLVRQYCGMYQLADLVEPSGLAVMDFTTRLQDLLDEVHGMAS